jgi:hypothetical protein
MVFQNKQVTFETMRQMRPFGIKNFNEFLKQNFFYGKATLNRLQNFQVSNVTSPKAPKTASKNYLFHQLMNVCQISALVKFI